LVIDLAYANGLASEHGTKVDLASAQSSGNRYLATALETEQCDPTNSFRSWRWLTNQTTSALAGHACYGIIVAA